MARAFLISLLSVLAAAAQPARVDLTAVKQIHDKPQLLEWATYYYEHPRPDLLVSAVDFLSRDGELLDGGEVISFLVAQIFQHNPKRIAGWGAAIEHGQEDQQFFLARTLWLANIPEAQAELRRLRSGGSDRRQEFVGELLNDSPPDWLAMDDIDLLWSIFSVTGEREPVERVIRMLPLVNVKGNKEKLVLGGAAHWSLTSNAFQHPRVMAICEAYLKHAPADVRPVLAEVIERAKRGEH
jgi:hypothetical protein